MSKTLLVCDCLGSQNVDAAALQVATGLPCAMLLQAFAPTR